MPFLGFAQMSCQQNDTIVTYNPAVGNKNINFGQIEIQKKRQINTQ